ncbi:RDD family protein [Luteimonas yindakuii]|uniref:RDD family protein n=1 Tax=Luteimonas yindakuii TaxID=2565782 RepID=UPI0010A5890F|nr:RDD family protein [Luteimonas yindakuii]QCO68641.1 RDD family protein [Luteimonas yindakuii]
MAAPTPAVSPPRPASLLQRWTAWSLDAALVAVVTLALVATSLAARLGALDAAFATLLDAMLQPLLSALPGVPSPAQLLGDPAVLTATSRFADALGHALLLPLVTFALLSWLYATAFECARGATPGKRVLRLRVISTDDGAPASCRHHALRQAAGLLSWLSLNLGHLMAAMPPRHQALHDRIAGMRVVTDMDALPRWTAAWLWLQAALACLALAVLMIALQARVDAALLRALG